MGKTIYFLTCKILVGAKTRVFKNVHTVAKSADKINKAKVAEAFKDLKQFEIISAEIDKNRANITIIEYLYATQFCLVSTETDITVLNNDPEIQKKIKGNFNNLDGYIFAHIINPKPIGHTNDVNI